MANETEKEYGVKKKTIGDHKCAIIRIYSDEFSAVGLRPQMSNLEAIGIVRGKLGLHERVKSRDSTNILLTEAKKKAKAEGRLEELQKVVNKFLQR